MDVCFESYQPFHCQERCQMLLDQNDCNLRWKLCTLVFQISQKEKKLNLSRKLQINILIVFRRVLAMHNDILHYFLFLNFIYGIQRQSSLQTSVQRILRVLFKYWLFTEFINISSFSSRKKLFTFNLDGLNKDLYRESCSN